MFSLYSTPTLHDRHAPRIDCRSGLPASQKICSIGKLPRNILLLSRVIQQIADATAIRQSAATHDKREPSCVWPYNASSFRSVGQDTLDQRVRRHEANVGYLSLAVGVAGDRGIIRPRMMFEAGNHLSSCWV